MPFLSRLGERCSGRRGLYSFGKVLAKFLGEEQGGVCVRGGECQGLPVGGLGSVGD